MIGDALTLLAAGIIAVPLAALALAAERWWKGRCRHTHVRCVHGDEINAVGGKRRRCLDCGRPLPGQLPHICTVTGRSHT